MKVLIDSNIILDVILERQPFYNSSAKILKLTDKDVEKYILSTAVKNIYNLAYNNLQDSEKITALLKKILSVFKILSVTEKEIFNALDLNWKDFEDAVQYSAAVSNNIDAIITRNMKGFSQGEVKILTPEEILDFIENENLEVK